MCARGASTRHAASHDACSFLARPLRAAARRRHGTTAATLLTRRRRLPCAALPCPARPRRCCLCPRGRSYALNTTPSAEGFLQPAQIETRRWNTSVIMSFAPPAALLSPDAPENRNKSAPFLAPATAVASFKLPAKQPDVRLVVQSTQPIIEVNGILRWCAAGRVHCVARARARAGGLAAAALHLPRTDAATDACSVERQPLTPAHARACRHAGRLSSRSPCCARAQGV